MIQAVFFDIGGILEITPITDWRNRWESRLNLSQGEINQHLARLWQAGSIGEISEAEYEYGVGMTLGLNDAQSKELIEDAWKEYLGEPNTEMIEFFSSLRTKYRTGIISNSFVGAREREEEKYGFHKLCEVIIYSHEVGILKPAPEIYLLACQKLEIKPEVCLFLDDVEENITAARALGMKAVLFKNNAQTFSEFNTILHQ